jgi:hypothetical protein
MVGFVVAVDVVTVQLSLLAEPLLGTWANTVDVHALPFALDWVPVNLTGFEDTTDVQVMGWVVTGVVESELEIFAGQPLLLTEGVPGSVTTCCWVGWLILQMPS